MKMEARNLQDIHEAYLNVYEQKIGVPLKDSSDRAAKEQLQKMIPKGEKVYTPKATLQNAAYEPEGEEIEEDVRSRDINARGGFDPRFDKKPTTTGSGQVRTPGATGPVAQAPKPAGGLLGSLDKVARDTAGKVGETIGREKAKSVPGANIPVIGDVIKNEGGRRGRNQAQGMYDKAKETIGNVLKQGYEPDTFDIILEFLVAEGYADTNESALVIMANMSEEWRQIILEGFPGTPSTPRAGDAGTSGLKMIKTTGGQTGYTNKHSSGETLPSGTVNKIMSGNLMVKNTTKKNNNSNLA